MSTGTGYAATVLNIFKLTMLTYAYSKFCDEERTAHFQPITSVPAASGAVAQIFAGTSGAGSSVMLTADGHLSLADLACSSTDSPAVTMRYRLGEQDFQMGKFAWGSLAPGPNPAATVIAGRKTIGLMDTRTGAVTRIFHNMGAKEYVRYVTATEQTSAHHQLLVASDSTVRLWDLRAVRATKSTNGSGPPVAVLPTCFRAEACLQTARHIVHPLRPGADWLLCIDQLGDLSLAGLDWSHKSCENLLAQSVDSRVEVRCVAAGRPDCLGQ
jgi:hypothetical protein